MNLGHLRILIAKERKQLLRDKSSIFFGLLLPVILLLIFGYGMSLDIRNIKLAIVSPAPDELTNRVVARFSSSEYFSVRVVRSSAEGTELVRTHRADGCLYLPEDLPRKLASREASILIAVNATNATQARLTENYIKSILLASLGSRRGGIDLKSRMYFNDANESSYFMIPGVIVIIMSIIGTKLTAMLMAKEYEHGNMESMFATPMTAAELLTAKAFNNFFLGMLGLTISLLFARYLFDVPIRGSILILAFGSGIYLLIALAAGLLISSLTRNQFIASQISLVVSFMPVFLLSGFLYEIRNMPPVIQYITIFIPARYYVDFLQTAFLVGNVWSNIFFNCAVMTLFAAVLMTLAAWKNPKTLEG
ncbi:MAG: ABC transporter permease [Victivallaceae bacterium]